MRSSRNIFAPCWNLSALPPADLLPTAYGAFRSAKPRATVLDVAPTPALTALRDTVRRAARTAGIEQAQHCIDDERRPRTSRSRNRCRNRPLNASSGT